MLCYYLTIWNAIHYITIISKHNLVPSTLHLTECLFIKKNIYQWLNSYTLILTYPPSFQIRRDRNWIPEYIVKDVNNLTHWALVTHICAITCRLIFSWTTGTSFRELCIKYTENTLEMLSANYRPSCFSLNLLRFLYPSRKPTIVPKKPFGRTGIELPSPVPITFRFVCLPLFRISIYQSQIDPTLTSKTLPVPRADVSLPDTIIGDHRLTE